MFKLLFPLEYSEAKWICGKKILNFQKDLLIYKRILCRKFFPLTENTFLHSLCIICFQKSLFEADRVRKCYIIFCQFPKPAHLRKNFFLYIKHLHSNITPTVARHIYVLICLVKNISDEKGKKIAVTGYM